MHANAQPLNNVPYINASGGAATADNVIPLTPADFTAGTEKTLTAGWYIVNENITHDRTITINGTVHLILKDEKFLTVTGSANSAGINVANPHSLTIYAQSTGANMGILNATGGSNGAGIGIGSNYAAPPRVNLQELLSSMVERLTPQAEMAVQASAVEIMVLREISP